VNPLVTSLNADERAAIERISESTEAASELQRKWLIEEEINALRDLIEARFAYRRAQEAREAYEERF